MVEKFEVTLDRKYESMSKFIYGSLKTFQWTFKMDMKKKVKRNRDVEETHVKKQSQGSK